MKRRAAIYCRISKDAEATGLGVARQERACRKLARERDLDVVAVLVDNDVSAYSRKPRPEFERLVVMLKAGEVDAVVVYHVDRLYRRLTDLQRLIDLVDATGVEIHTVASGVIDLSTASGKLTARVVGAAAEHESDRIGERVRLKNVELAQAGRPPGGRAPYGYQWAGEPSARRYEINPTEAEAVRLAARLVVEGGRSLLAVARDLDAAGYRTREGRPWHHASVRAALLNPAIAGLRVHRREIAGHGQWEPILDRATWERVRAVIADPARKRRRPNRDYLLSGLVTNPAGQPMNGRPDGKPGRERRTYATRSPADPAVSIGADELEDYVVVAVLSVLDDAVLPTPDASPSAEEAAAEVAAIEAELAEMAALRGRGEISLAEWTAMRGPLVERLERARQAAGRRIERSSAVGRLLSARGAARKAWPTLGTAERREVIAAVVDRVVVGPASRGRWTTFAERVDPARGWGIRWRA